MLIYISWCNIYSWLVCGFHVILDCKSPVCYKLQYIKNWSLCGVFKLCCNIAPYFTMAKHCDNMRKLLPRFTYFVAASIAYCNSNTIKLWHHVGRYKPTSYHLVAIISAYCNDIFSNPTEKIVAICARYHHKRIFCGNIAIYCDKILLLQ